MIQFRIVLASLLAVASFAALAQESKPNPFTGRTSEMEEDLLKLERAKIRAALANEELTREKADMERRRLGVAVPGRVESSRIDTPPSPAPARAPVRKASPGDTSATQQVTPSMASPTPMPPIPPRLIGTVETKAGWVAVVDYQGRVMNIPEGKTVSGVTAMDITPVSAKLNGRQTPFASIVSRVYADEPRLPSSTSTTGQQTRVVTAQQAEDAIRQQPRTAPMDLGKLMPPN